MLIARPRSWFSRSFDVHDADGAIVAELDIALLKEGAVLRHDGHTYRIEREGFLSGPWRMEEDGTVLFEAHKPSLIRNRFTVVVKNASLELAPKSWLMRRFVLVGPDWRDLGEIRRPSWWWRRVEVDLSELVPVEARLFFLFLAIVLWHRADSTAAASG